MIITEQFKDNNHYLIIDHDSTLPKIDSALITDIRNNAPTVGYLVLTRYNDVIDYTVDGEITSAGRISMSDNTCRIEYTKGRGFDITGVDFNNPNANTFMSFLCNDCNKKNYYAYLFGESCNCVVYVDDMRIYSFVNDHSFNGISGGIQLYKDGMLVTTLDSNCRCLGLPIDTSQFKIDDEYMNILDRLVEFSGCVITADDIGYHVVATEARDVDALRTFYNAPTFTTHGYHFDINCLMLEGAIYSFKDSQNGRYALLRSGDIDVFGHPTWFEDMKRFDLDNIAGIINLINEDYNPASIVEYYANKNIDVNFVDNLNRISGTTFDASFVIQRYADKAYYKADTETLIIDVQPSSELQTLSNIMTNVHELSALSPEMSERFEERVEHNFWHMINGHHYMPFAATAQQPLLAKVTKSDGDTIDFDLIIRPALFRSIYVNDQWLYETVKRALLLIVPYMVGCTKIGEMLIKYSDPTLGSYLFDLLDKANYSHVEKLYRVTNEMTKAQMLYDFSTADYTFDSGTIAHAVTIEGLINQLGKHAVPITVVGRTSYYKLCPVFIQKMRMTLSNGPFLAEDPPKDYNLITELLPEEKRAMFTRLFTENSLCADEFGGLFPFHLLLNVNVDSIPAEILASGDFHTYDLNTHCSVGDVYYQDSTSKIGVFYASTV